MHILCSHQQDFVLLSPHTAELPWHGSCNLILVFRLHLSKQFICIHSLTLDDTWHLKSIIFENDLSAACKIGETRCCVTKNSTAKISSVHLLPHFSISSCFHPLWWGWHIRTEQSYAEETCSKWFLSAVLQFQQLWWGPHAPCTTLTGQGHWVCIRVFRVGTFQLECILASQCQESLTGFLS